MKKFYFLILSAILAATLLPQASFAQGWYNSSWQYRKAITIDYTKVSGSADLSSFPVLVSLSSDAGLSAHALSSGYDILFTSNDGTSKIPYQRESYSSGTLVAWVQVPTVSHTANTTIYMYYGNSSATDQQQASSVWDANYLGVWHLSQATGVNQNDATSNGNTIAPTNSPAQTTGKIDGSLNFNGSSQFAQTGASSSLAISGTIPITESAWVNLSRYAASGYYDAVVMYSSTGYGSSSFDKGIGVDPSGHALFYFYDTGQKYATSSTTLSTGTWYYVVGEFNGSQGLIYVNGVQVGSIAGTGTAGLGASPYVTMSFTTSQNNTFHDLFGGTVDELRISNTARSADWITTEYNNQSSPSSFYSVGTQQTLVTLTDGSLYNPPGALPSNNPNPIGQFELTAVSSGPTLNSVTVSYPVSGGTNTIEKVHLYSSSISTFSTGTATEIASYTGNTSPVTFSSLSTSISTGGTYFYVAVDLSAASPAKVRASIASSSDLTLSSNGGLSGTFPAYLSGSDVTLPVQATAFKAVADVGSVTLTWETKSEVDNAGFNVLRQDPGTTAFKLIGSYTTDDSLKGLGTSSVGRSYNFTDNQVVGGATYQYKIQSVSTSGQAEDLNTMSVTVDVPKSYALYQNYPNPFNPSTTIQFDVKQQSTVTLEIYNTLGQRVEYWNYGIMDAGRYNENINISKYASGIYFYRLVAVGKDGQRFEATKKLVLAK